MTFRRPVPVTGLVVLALSLTACGSGSSSGNGQQITEGLAQGKIAYITMGSGLACDVFDTNRGGGLDCNFTAFTQPAGWVERTGSMETQDALDGTVEVVRFSDGHLCVTFDGNRSGVMTCSYP